MGRYYTDPDGIPAAIDDIDARLEVDEEGEVTNADEVFEAQHRALGQRQSFP